MSLLRADFKLLRTRRLAARSPIVVHEPMNSDFRFHTLGKKKFQQNA